MPALTDGGGGGTPPPPLEPPPPPPPPPPPEPPPASPAPRYGGPYLDLGDLVGPPQLIVPPPVSPPPASAPPPPPAYSGVTAPVTIIPPGHDYLDLGDLLGPLDLIPPPPKQDGPTAGPPAPPTGDDQTGDPLRGWELDDPFATRSLQGANPPLKGYEWVSAMVDLAELYRVDYLAVAADVLNEGHDGTVGDGGLAYGPFQDHLTEFRGRPFYGRGRNNPTVNAWAWSRNGLDYSMRLIAFGEAAARDLKGQPALERIVRGYEKPADIPKAISVRGATLRNLQAMGSQWLPYTAGRMLGPVGGGGQDTVPVTGAPDAPQGAVKPTKQWKATLHFLANDVPLAGANARRAGGRVHNAVRSVLWRTPTG